MLNGPMTRRERLITIVVPAHNEIGNIRETIEGLSTIRDHLAIQSLELRIFVIDDGSLDGTADEARAAGANLVISHRRNMGLGAAVRTGLIAARNMGAEICVKFDADLQHDPKDILALIEPILRGNADLVYGERFSNIEYKMPIVRRWGNKVFTSLMRRLTGWPVEDSQPGIFAAHANYLEVFDLPGDYNYTQQVLLDAYLKSMRFAQVPVSFRQRRTGQSFISLRYPLKVLPQIVLVTCISKPMAIFFPVGFAMFVFAAGVFTVQVIEWFYGLSARPVQNVNLVLGSAMFGLQIMLFGVLAKLIIMTRRPPRSDHPGRRASQAHESVFHASHADSDR